MVRFLACCAAACLYAAVVTGIAQAATPPRPIAYSNISIGGHPYRCAWFSKKPAFVIVCLPKTKSAPKLAG